MNQVYNYIYIPFILLCVSFAQAMLDVAAHHGWLVTALNITNLVQMVVQGRWIHDSSLLTLPNIELQHLYLFRYVILLNVSRFPISFHFLLLIVFEWHCCARECSLTNQKQNSVFHSDAFPNGFSVSVFNIHWLINPHRLFWEPWFQTN